MMRLILASWWGLAIFWLLAHPLDALPGQGQSVPPSGDRWPREVQGFGLSVELAREDAINKLLEETQSFLHIKQAAPLLWQPSKDFVRRELLDGPGHAAADVNIGKAGSAKSWVYPIKALDLAKVAMFDEQTRREARREDRVLLFGYWLAGAAVLVGLLTGACLVRERHICRSKVGKK